MSKYNTTNRNISLRKYYRILSLMTIVFIITMSIIISFSTVTAFHQSKGYVFVKKWGSKGTADGQFQRPHDLDFDSAEKYLYTVDRDGARVQVFDKNGTFIKKWGSEGTGDGQFIDPEHFAIDSDGYVYISDRGKNDIQVFKPIDNVPHK